MTSGHLTALDNNIFAIIANLKRQTKGADTGSIHAQFKKK